MEGEIVPSHAPVESRGKTMRVCYFGTYRQEYSRNRILIEGLRQAGLQVVECCEPFWPEAADRVRLVTWGWMLPGFWVRLARAGWRLARRLRNIEGIDLIVVGYPGQLDVFLATLLARRKQVPVVWDVFMSLYLLARERGLQRLNPTSTAMLHLVERRALALPALLLLDTAEHADWLLGEYSLPPTKIALVPLGADDATFFPRPRTAPSVDTLRVLYYGSFIPSHGTLRIVEAAKLLCHNARIQFTLIGDGPTKASTVMLAERDGLANVTFYDWMAQSKLAERIAESDIVLGAFGQTAMARMTIQNKVYEAMAMAKAVITADTPATRSAFHHKEDIYLCNPGSGQAIADAVLELQIDPSLREAIAAGGNAVFRKRYTVAAVGEIAAAHLRSLVAVSRQTALR
jgi:glycosyltransferase involved in cell wall biosynthesis